nr:MAG TPA: hypothetical protein [Caudoviricetes sp.]
MILNIDNIDSLYRLSMLSYYKLLGRWFPDFNPSKGYLYFDFYRKELLTQYGYCQI